MEACYIYAFTVYAQLQGIWGVKVSLQVCNNISQTSSSWDIKLYKILYVNTG